MKYRVFIDPDGTDDVGLAVIVHASTGVIYAHQCGGLATDQREVEGFLVPVARRDPARAEGAIAIDVAIATFFRREFRGNCPPWSSEWTPERIDRLADLVGQIPFWSTDGDRDERTYLVLDRARVDDLTEAWMPVVTPYGVGTLVAKNCD